jgi:hypothetical protein
MFAALDNTWDDTMAGNTCDNTMTGKQEPTTIASTSSSSSSSSSSGVLGLARATTSPTVTVAVAEEETAPNSQQVASSSSSSLFPSPLSSPSSSNSRPPRQQQREVHVLSSICNKLMSNSSKNCSSYEDHEHHQQQQQQEQKDLAAVDDHQEGQGRIQRQRQSNQRQQQQPIFVSISHHSIDQREEDEEEESDEMVDLEQGNILRELEEHRTTHIISSSDQSSVTSHIDKERLTGSTKFMWCFDLPLQQNGAMSYQYKWGFSVVILLLGSVASALVLWLGLTGVHQNSEQQFIHEATQLTNVLELSWLGYETFALWIHESCHFNILAGIPYNIDDDGVALTKGFCSRDKFRYVFLFVEDN